MNKSRTLLLCGLIAFLTFNAQAGQIDAEAIVKNKNNQMEAVLSARNPIQTIEFLHDQVKDNATFQISYSNSFMPAEKAYDSLNLNKTDYINSFVQGSNYIDNYSVKIKTESISVKNNLILAKEITKEEGVMLDPYTLDNGIPFISTTTCVVQYEIMNQKDLKTKSGQCITETGRSDTI